MYFILTFFLIVETTYVHGGMNQYSVIVEMIFSLSQQHAKETKTYESERVKRLMLSMVMVSLGTQRRVHKILNFCGLLKHSCTHCERFLCLRVLHLVE